MNKAAWLGAVSCLALSFVGYGEREAAACGGCFTPPPPPPPPGAPPGSVDSVITAERMIFSISKDQTTLYDEITYSGSPSSFAWVLPIKGEVTVGLSADILFAVMDGLTAVAIEPPPSGCPAPPTDCGYFGFGGGGGFGGCGGASGAASGFSPTVPYPALDAATADAGVTILAQDQVGPYEAVQLRSNDGSALTSWLDSHGYRVPASDAQVIAHYVAEGLDFLALKLVPGEGVRAMQPVRVTTKGAFPVLPLRMVGVGTGPTTGITLWIVADGRWEPQNFPFFTITSDELVWDWTTSSSNYERLRQTKEVALHGGGWQIESSIELNRYTVSNTLDRAVSDNYTGIGSYGTSFPTAPPPSGSKDSGVDAPAPDATPAEAAAPDAAPVDGGPSDAGAVDAPVATDATPRDAAKVGDSGRGTPPHESRLELAAADIEVLFAGIAPPNARVTRLRGDIAHSALSADLVVHASVDASEVSNRYVVTREKAEALCTVYDENCSQLPKEFPRDEAIAFEKRVEAELASQNTTSSTGGCTCKTSPRSQVWRTPVGILVGIGLLGGLRAGQRRRSHRR